MAIMDGLPKTEAEARTNLKVSAEVVGRMLARAKMSPRQRSIIDLMNEGLSVADICKITREERDAVLTIGCRQLQVGDVKAAEETLQWLLRLEPTDERVIYALGATYQAQGFYEIAGRAYLHFIAFDATNPDGHMRLGECFMANREPHGARASFETAKLLAADRKGGAAIIAEADRLITLLPAEDAEAG